MSLNKKASFISGIQIWTLSLGCIIGWGAFVMPGSTFLPDSGFLGSVIGIAIATIIILVISSNYSYLTMNIPGDASSYIYARDILGHDHAFLAAWSLILAYISLLWANSVTFTMVARYLIGPELEWGFHYTVAGYDIYAGEIVANIILDIIFALIICYFPKIAQFCRTFFGIMLFTSVAALFIVVATSKTASHNLVQFAMGDRTITFKQVMDMVIIAPWLFVGFEVVTHIVGRVTTKARHIFIFAGLAIFSGMLIYLCLLFIGASNAPEAYASWKEYVSDLNNLTGLEHIPVFYNAYALAGIKGLILVGIAVFSALTTSVFGFYKGAMRVVQMMAEDRLLPALFGKEKNDVPRIAVIAIFLCCLPIPFIGRTAMGWNADVSTLSTSIVYAYISICCFTTARKSKSLRYEVCGILGIIISAFSFIMLLVPNIFTEDVLSAESYFMFVVWSFLGIIFYWIIFKKQRRLGYSAVMWITMLFVMFFALGMWMRLSSIRRIEAVEGDSSHVYRILLENNLIQIFAIVFVLGILFSLFSTVLKREKDVQNQKVQAEEQNRAKTAFLSSMSHEIRTPINAVLGLDEMILRESDETAIKNYAADIQSSGKMLLSIINDILDFSKIEAGKMEIVPAEYDLAKMVACIYSMTSTRAKAKNLTFSVNVDPSSPSKLYGDENRIKQCILNILTNAVKYTHNGGVTLNIGTEKVDDKHVSLSVQVIDTGIGIKAEDLHKLCAPFERIEEKRNRSIEGTGLGMSIVANLLRAMNSRLDVKSEYGHGSDFSFVLLQEVVDWSPAGSWNASHLADCGISMHRQSFQAPKARILVVDDTPMNLTVIKGLLKSTFIKVDTAPDALTALIMAKETPYHVIFIDHMMPNMDGIEMLRELKIHGTEVNKNTPCIVLTANAISGSRRAYMGIGFDDYLSKPIDTVLLESMLQKYIPKELILHPNEEGYVVMEQQSDTTNLNNGDGDTLMLSLFGLNSVEALKNCGSTQLFSQSIKIFCDDIEEKSKQIEDCTANKEWKNFTVFVHALKSSARLIGAMELSATAAELERAGDNAKKGKEEAIAAINEKVPALLAQYRSYKEKLLPLCRNETESVATPKPIIERKVLEDALNALVEAASAFDFNMADSIIAQLDGYTMPADFTLGYNEIKAKIRAVDSVGTQELISSYKKAFNENNAAAQK